MKRESKNFESLKSSRNNLSCTDKQCPVHGSLKARGRAFKGYIIKKFPRRIVIRFERIIYIRKYERYTKKKTKIHARVPACMEEKVKIGDYVLVQECRPLSKLIHFVLIEKVGASEDIGQRAETTSRMALRENGLARRERKIGGIK